MHYPFVETSLTNAKTLSTDGRTLGKGEWRRSSSSPAFQRPERIIPREWAFLIWSTWPYRGGAMRSSRRRELRIDGVLRSSAVRPRGKAHARGVFPTSERVVDGGGGLVDRC